MVVAWHGEELMVKADGVSKATSWFCGAPITRGAGGVEVGMGLLSGVISVQLQLGYSPGTQDASIC